VRYGITFAYTGEQRSFSDLNDKFSRCTPTKE
jgi:hypothetical protein